MGKNQKTPVIKGSLERERYTLALRDLQARIKQANEINAQMSVINKKLGTDAKTVKELEAYLEESTGIKNLTMASDSLLVKSEYLRILELSQPTLEEELITVNDNGIIEESAQAIDILKDRFTPNVAPEFQETARKFLDFTEWYSTLSLQEKRSLVQFKGTEFKVKLDSMLYVHR